jgi:hypothetical protein
MTIPATVTAYLRTHAPHSFNIEARLERVPTGT